MDTRHIVAIVDQGYAQRLSNMGVKKEGLDSRQSVQTPVIPAEWQSGIAALVDELNRLRRREIDLLNANSTLVEANRMLRGMKPTDAKSDFEWGSEIYLSGRRPVWLSNGHHLQYRTSRQSGWSQPDQWHQWQMEDWLHVYSIRLSRNHAVYAKLGEI
jgi:hypothetical protein